MPVVTTMDRPLIPEGEHVFTLAGVDEVLVESQFSKAGEKVTKWVWSFESEDKDDDGLPYIHKEWTRTTYGHPKANLTILLNQLLPGLTTEDANHLNTDNLVGKKFVGVIRHAPDEKGVMRADLAYIKPKDYDPKAPKKARKDSEEIPF